MADAGAAWWHTGELVGLVMAELGAQHRTRELARCAQVSRLWHREAARVLWTTSDPYVIVHPASRGDEDAGLPTAAAVEAAPRIVRARGMLSYVQPARQQHYADLVRRMVFRQDLQFSGLQLDELAGLARLRFPRLRRVEVVELLEPRKADEARLVLAAVAAAMTTSPLAEFAIRNSGQRYDRRVDFFLQALPWSSCGALRSFVFRGTTGHRHLVEVLRHLPMLRHLEIFNTFMVQDLDVEHLLAQVWKMDGLESLSLDFRAYFRNDPSDQFVRQKRLDLEEWLSTVNLPGFEPSMKSLRKVSLCFRSRMVKRILDAMEKLPIEEAELKPRFFPHDNHDGTLEGDFFPESTMECLHRLSIRHPGEVAFEGDSPARRVPLSWVHGLRNLRPSLQSISWTDFAGNPIQPEFDEKEKKLLEDFAVVKGWTMG